MGVGDSLGAVWCYRRRGCLEAGWSPAGYYGAVIIQHSVADIRCGRMKTICGQQRNKSRASRSSEHKMAATVMVESGA